MHLNIAVSRALLNKRDGKLRTQSFGNEIIYHITPQHSIQMSLEKHGIKNCQEAFFAVCVDYMPEQVA